MQTQRLYTHKATNKANGEVENNEALCYCRVLQQQPGKDRKNDATTEEKPPELRAGWTVLHTNTP